MVQAIKDGVSAVAVKDEPDALAFRKAFLMTVLAAPTLPALHPRMADVFRQKTLTLAAGLEHDDHRDAARQALRGILDRIVIPPGEGMLQVVGNIASMLATAQGRTTIQMRSVMLVAGGGFEPPTFGL